MKFFKIILVFLIIAAFAISLWNKIHLRKYKRTYEIQKKEKAQIEDVGKKIEEGRGQGSQTVQARPHRT